MSNDFGVFADTHIIYQDVLPEVRLETGGTRIVIVSDSGAAPTRRVLNTFSFQTAEQVKDFVRLMTQLVFNIHIKP